MVNERVQKLIAQQDAQAALFRKYIGGFSTPPSDVVIEKIVEVQGEPVEAKIGNNAKKITPTATIARIENDLIVIPGTGDKLSKSQVDKLLKPTQKGQLTRALNANLENRMKKLTPA